VCSSIRSCTESRSVSVSASVVVPLGVDIRESRRLESESEGGGRSPPVGMMVRVEPCPCGAPYPTR
jgi:hypothetical protein